ncbi:MAG: Universal stress protein family protein [Firmicutes bacterium ADurb.Bin182]|nr:MAG: Universal stress protein family protein [Firmicutes bacterium ADurb.Bin182]
MDNLNGIMVCVTYQKTCDKLISHGIKLNEGLNAPLYVVHCVQTGRNFLGNPYEGEALEYLFTAAQIAGGELTLLRKDNVDDALVDFAKIHDIGLIVMGSSPGRHDDNIISRLKQRLPDVKFEIVG